MADPIETITRSGVLDELRHRGFTMDFTLRQGRLRVAGTGRTFVADQVEIAEAYRFEGISDPDDMAILYAIETENGVRGTLADAFGVYPDPCVTEFIEDAPLRGHGSHPITVCGTLEAAKEDTP